MKKLLKFVVSFLVILISACILFESVDQPTSALPDDIFIVSIDVTTEGGGYAPYFGVCLPNGWTIPGDSFPCTGVYNEIIYYDSLVSSEQENASPAPAGYYWWAGIGAAVATDSGSVNGQVEIQTDNQIGLFSIDYMLGDSSVGPDGREVNQDRSNDHLIEIIYDEYTPRILQAIVEGTSVVLNWETPLITEGLLGYNIYRDGQQINPTIIGDTTYTDENPLEGIHYYAVSSLYDDGNEHLIPYEILVIFGENLYVSLDGDNSNSGSSFEDALLTISFALSIITPDSLHPITFFLAPGIYSPSTNGEIFPLEWKDYLSLEGISEEESILDADSLSGIMRFNYVNYAMIRNITVRNGSVLYPEYGGGIYCDNSSPILINVTISENTAGSGGGISCIRNSSPSLQNVTITNNTADTGAAIGCEGGGIYCEESSPSLQNVTITGNSASGSYGRGGGAICCVESSPSLENVTITGNSASGNDAGGGAIYCRNDSHPLLINSILWNDSPQEIYFYEDNDPNLITISYSDIQGGEAGIVTNNNGTVNWLEGNIDEDPLFVGTGVFPYSLLEDSPCIDAGNPDPIYYDPEDLSNPGYAIYPAMGTVINDMGAYGGPNAIGWPPVGVEDNLIVQTPEVFLHQNYPNPFNPTTIINYSLKENSKVSINIYNIKGQKVKQLIRDQLTAGQHSVVWDGRDNNNKYVASGIYFYKLETKNFKKTRKMILLK